ncbi:MAG: thioredoxin [Candidatus Borkfalkiaceae bacterium]|nr:thioredoxin [Clostridia bacterium]MDY6223598.1 thioredoxin [Christensenellaceae bacterium]
MKQVTEKELEELLKGEKTVFADFWATWCGPCRMLAPVFENLAEKYADQAEFVKVNVDEETDAAMKYGISSIPNVIAFKNGNVAASNLGFVPESVLEDFIAKNL